MEQYRNFFKEKPPQISILLKCGSDTSPVSSGLLAFMRFITRFVFAEMPSQLCCNSD